MLCLVAMFAAGARGQDKPPDVASTKRVASEVVSFPSGDVTLHALLFRPEVPVRFQRFCSTTEAGKTTAKNLRR